MSSRTMRRGTVALIATAAVGAGSLTAIAATTPSTSRSLTNGSSELSFSKPSLTASVPTSAKRVRVTLRYRNTGATTHNIGLRGKGLRAKVSPNAGPGRGVAVTATVAPGTYTYFCAIPGHEAAGMKGTLRVRKAR